MGDPLTWTADVHEVPWDTLEDLDGPASEIPGLLIQAFEPSPQEAVDAIEEIADCVDTTVRMWVVVSEPDVLTSSVPALLPFLVRLASDRDRPAEAREAAMNLVVDLTGLAHRVRPENLDTAWPGAWSDQRPRIEALLLDPLPSIVLHAVDALAREAHAVPRLFRVLHGRWEAAGDGAEGAHEGQNGQGAPAGAEGPRGRDEARAGASGTGDGRRTRLRLLTRAVELLGARPDGIPPDVLAWLLDRREHGDLDERMVVAFASPALVPADPLPLVLEGIVGDAARPVTGRPLWSEIAYPALSSGTLLVRYGLLFVARALADDRPARERIVEALIDHPRAAVRLGAVRLAHDLVAEYRSGGERWAGPVGALLDDPDSEVRAWSLRLLTMAGSAARPSADRLAELARPATGPDGAADDSAGDGEDPEEAGTARAGAGTGQIGTEAAFSLLTLALMGDARAVPLLTARADRPGFGFDPGREAGRDLGLPDILEHLAGHADVLVPHLRERLRGEGGDTDAVLRSLVRWGPAAAPLADDVAALLDTGRHAERALGALAAIGPAAAGHAARVRSLGGDAPGAGVARAYLGITGDAGAALDLLPDRPAMGHEGLQELLDGIGPPAVRHAPALREHLESHLEQGHLRETRALSALWSITGDTAFVLRVLLSPAQRVLTTWAATRVGPPAVRLLGRIGPDAAEALPLLYALRDSERSAWPGWTGMGWKEALRDRRLVVDVRDAVRRIEGG